METNYFKTDVIFRKEKDGDILAVFPYDIANFRGNCTCYAHIGQHSAMVWEYLRGIKPAKELEYSDLYRELISIGYDLNVIKKRNYSKYLKAYRGILAKE